MSKPRALLGEWHHAPQCAPHRRARSRKGEAAVLTGLELALGPALAKSAGVGLTRVAGWGAGAVMDGRRRKKIRALTYSKGRAQHLEAVESLPDSQLQRLALFCDSAEIEKIATTLSSAYLLEGGRKADKVLEAVRLELQASLGVALGADAPPLVSQCVFNALNEAVLARVQPLLDRPKLSPAVEAELIATAGSMASATIRNTELLRGLTNINEIHDFESEYRAQVAAMFATMRLPHAGTTRQVPYDDLFVTPMLSVDPDVTGHERTVRVQVAAELLLQRSTRIVVLGDPGGGKSTLSRKLTYDLSAQNIPGLTNKVPFFVELREYAESVRGKQRQTLVEHLETLCRSPFNLPAPPDAIDYLLLNNRAVVILDGLDELLDVSLRRDVVEAVEGFALRYPTCPILVTSRRIGYGEAPLSERFFAKASLGEFADDQVEEYVGKWFALDETIEEARSGHLAQSFMRDSHFVSDLRVNPLMLSLMCGIYASENYIPRNRPDVYEKCALLLFERWDKQRGIVPDLSFDAHVQAALRALALFMLRLEVETTQQVSNTTVPPEGIPRETLVDFLTRYLREKRFDSDEDAENAAVEFINFCKGRAWVLTDVGAETYGFTHRTFLEYFAASQLVRLHTNAADLFAQLKDNVRVGGLDVVAQLAVQILGKTTEDGADDFLELLLSDTKGVTQPDAHAISFAARSLTFIVPRPKILRTIVARCVDIFLAMPGDLSIAFSETNAIGDLLGCSSENAPRVAGALREEISARLLGKPGDEQALMHLALLPPQPTRPNSYWREWARENFNYYDAQVRSMSRRFFWLSIIRYEIGDIMLGDVLQTHGVRALYAYRINGSTDHPPLVYRILKSRRSGGYSGLLGPVRRGRTEAIAADLIEYLPQVKAPWLTYRKDYQRTAWAFDVEESRQPAKWYPLMMLLALPLLEDSDLIRHRPGIHPLVHELAEARIHGKVSPDVAEQIEALRTLSPEAGNLVDLWGRDGVNLMRRVPRTRSRGTPRS